MVRSITILFAVAVTVLATSPSLAQEPADSKPLFTAAVTETGYDMSLEELSRDGNRSRVRVEYRLTTSVGGPMWTACQMAELTKYRGFRYHVVLDEVSETAPAGGERFPITVIYDVGFLNSDTVDLKAEFGTDSRREIVDIEEYALICGRSQASERKQERLEQREERPGRPAGEPLYVVDGIVLEVAPDVDALDIATIEVVKGDSAVALYGERAANGVVVITTRRPRNPAPVAAMKSDSQNLAIAQRVPIAPVPKDYPAPPETHLNRDWPYVSELGVPLYPDFAEVRMHWQPVQEGKRWDRWEIATFVSQHTSDSILDWYAEHLKGWKVDVTCGVVIPGEFTCSDATAWKAPHIEVTDVEGGKCTPGPPRAGSFPCRSQAIIVYRPWSTPVTTRSPRAYSQYLIAREFQVSGDRQQSRERLREAVTLDPEFAMAWRMLAANLLALRDSSQAEEAIQQALRLRDRVSETERLHIEAFDAVRRNDWGAYLRAVDRIVDLNPRDALAHFNRAVALYVLGRNAQSVEAYDRLIELNPRHRGAHSNRAAALQRLGRYAESFESFKRGTFGRLFERYLSLAPHKAIALARDSGGRSAWGHAFGYSTRVGGVERAMNECVDSSVRQRVRSQCRLYAVGDEVVWGNDRFGQEAPSERASVRIREFGKGGCAEWSDYDWMMGRARPLIAWRWRLCDYSDDQYDIRVEFRNPTDRNIEFAYRFASVPAPCDNIDAAVDRLSMSLSGQVSLRPEERKRHRGRRGLVDKDHWTGYFNLCVYNWRSSSVTDSGGHRMMRWLPSWRS